MSIQPLATVKAHLSQLVEAAVTTHEHVVITRNGTPAAVLVSYEEWERVVDTLQVLSEPDTLQDLADADTDCAEGHLLSADEVAASLAARRRADG